VAAQNGDHSFANEFGDTIVIPIGGSSNSDVIGYVLLKTPPQMKLFLYNFKISWENTLNVSHYHSSLSITHFTLISSPSQQGTNNPVV